MKIWLLAVAVLMAGCSGGTMMGGLLPAPKFLNGDLDGLRYTSPDETFSVEAPVPDSNQWLYTEVLEKQDVAEDQGYEMVGFKTPVDRHFYYTRVTQYHHPVAENHKPLILADTVQRITDDTKERFGTDALVIAENTVSCGAKDFTYTVVHQSFEAHGSSYDKYLLISLAFFGDTLALVSSELNYPENSSDIPLAQIRGRTLEKHNHYVCSLKVFG